MPPHPPLALTVCLTVCLTMCLTVQKKKGRQQQPPQQQQQQSVFQPLQLVRAPPPSVPTSSLLNARPQRLDLGLGLLPPAAPPWARPDTSPLLRAAPVSRHGPSAPDPSPPSRPSCTGSSVAGQPPASRISCPGIMPIMPSPSSKPFMLTSLPSGNLLVSAECNVVNSSGSRLVSEEQRRVSSGGRLVSEEEQKVSSGGHLVSEEWRDQQHQLLQPAACVDPVLSYFSDLGSYPRQGRQLPHTGLPAARGGAPHHPSTGGVGRSAEASGEGGRPKPSAGGVGRSVAARPQVLTPPWGRVDARSLGPVRRGGSASAGAPPTSRDDSSAQVDGLAHPPFCAVGGTDAASRGVAASRGGSHTQAPALGGADGSQVAVADSECMDYVAEELVLLRGLRIKGAVDVGELQPRVGG